MGRKKKKIVTDRADASFKSQPFAGLTSDGLLQVTESIHVKPAKHQLERKRRGRVDVRREKSGRGGKWVTVASGEGFLTTAPCELEKLLKKLKVQCACGGTLKGKVLEIQGDQRQFIAHELDLIGYRVVWVGG